MLQNEGCHFEWFVYLRVFLRLISFGSRKFIMKGLRVLVVKKFCLLLISLLVCTSTYALNKNKINQILDNSGLRYTWSGNSSLWIENPGRWTKMEMEKAGYMLCRIDRGFIVTWWQDVSGPRGQIVKISCL